MRDAIVNKAISSLGRGFDLTSDFKLKFCKGHDRLILLNESEKRELLVPGFGSVGEVSVDIKCNKGDRTRYQTDILSFNEVIIFHSSPSSRSSSSSLSSSRGFAIGLAMDVDTGSVQMSELFNQKSSIPGKIPSGFFNSMFGFQSGCWASDAENTKHLGIDGFFVTLFDIHIDRYPLVLSDQVRQAVPTTWDPGALARFIDKYGTHIIVGLSIGGHDVVLVRQEKTSKLEASELKEHLYDLGDQLFTGSCSFSAAKAHRTKVPRAFNLFDPQTVAFTSFSSVSTKDGITVICSKKGGHTAVNTHCEWLPTVPSSPDAIYFSFIPITSLLNGVPGKGFLSHAINLYLRYKPPIGDLHYFLDFQAHKIWAPIHNELPLNPAPNMTSSSPALNFNLMGPKLYVNTSQVMAVKRPVTGMRLYLEGIKCNRLAIHIQHLSNTPFFLENKIEDDTSSYCSGSEENGEEGYLESINGKRFSHVCTAPVKYDPKWVSEEDTSFIVTGAQLHILKKEDSRSVLHLRLFYSKVSDSHVVQSNWARGSSKFSQKSGIFSAISTSISGNPVKEKQEAVVVDSSVFPGGPPVPIQTQKLLKFVDVSEIYKGPQDSPGHWLVTGARLYLQKGKICLHVKFSLLHICSL